MDLIQVGKALSNETRLKLLQILADEPDSAVKVHQRYVTEHDEEMHRESIYRALEVLVDAQLLAKEYEQDEGLVYRLAHEQLRVDLREAEISSVPPETAQDGP